MRNYDVRAVHWSGGWELHIKDVGVTQVRVFKDAAGQVADYLETIGAEEADEIRISADIGALTKDILAARKMTKDAEELQRVAAVKWRTSARELRDLGLSVTDVASIMNVSRGRVSQLLS